VSWLVGRARVKGFPTSANRASSFHLHWLPRAELVEASVVLEVLRAPQVSHLYFWALQVGFASASGPVGGAHLGLQWISTHPGSTAVNWGGYDSAGNILNGSQSSLPSADGNPNTRDFTWRPGRPYRLQVTRGPSPGAWTGLVTDLSSDVTVEVRHLYGAGDRLVGPMVWSEVFARCEDPPVEVKWSEPEGRTPDGTRWSADSYRITYQSHGQGGCANTDVGIVAGGVVQVTGVVRQLSHQTVISVGQDR
jgi:hypothetical protein